MPLNTLVVSATVNTSNTAGNDTLTGTSGADAYYINGASTGRDVIASFGKNDTLIVDTKIYDSNNDGIVSFGTNGVLDLDGGPDTGGDYVALGGINAKKGVRYLGTMDGYFVYADATVRPKYAKEGTVGNDTLNGTAGSDVFFFDTALGLNLGSDTINGFGTGDRLVTTTKIYDHNNDGFINFATNNKLDLPGAVDGFKGDSVVDGTVTINGTSNQLITRVEYLGDATYNGVHYYFYGPEGAAHTTTLSF